MKGSTTKGLTKSCFVAVLVLAMVLPVFPGRGSVFAEEWFKDVPKDHWAAGAIYEFTQNKLGSSDYARLWGMKDERHFEPDKIMERGGCG